MVIRDVSRRATARDVALLAEVSVATVSLVANGKSAGRVTPDTERRVRQVIAELDYRVNTTASALAQGRRDTVAFVSPDPANPFFSLVLDGMAATLDDSLSLTILWPRRGDDYDPATVQRALAGDLAGIVLAGPSTVLLDAISPTCPTILLDSGESRPGMSSMDPDVESAGIAMADHLVGLGHTRVAYVGVSRDKSTFHHRRDTLQRELVARGASIAVPDLVVERLTISSSFVGAVGVLADWVDAGITAVVCADDLVAYGVLQASEHLRIPVPATLSVAGFNNLPFSELATPPLTTVDFDARELGESAGRALNQMLRGEGVPAPGLVPAHIVPRASTARARA